MLEKVSHMTEWKMKDFEPSKNAIYRRFPTVRGSTVGCIKCIKSSLRKWISMAYVLIGFENMGGRQHQRHIRLDRDPEGFIPGDKLSKVKSSG